MSIVRLPLALSLTVAAIVTPTAAAEARAPARPRRTTVPIMASEGGTYQYKVQQGDTLRKIAGDYFIGSRDRAAYRTVAAINHVGDRLKAGTTLVIPRRYLNIVPARAVVAAFRGTVSLGANRPAKVNAVVTEGARIETGANSSISFTLEDGSTISLPSQSVFVLERLRLVLLSGELQHVFRLEGGRSQFVVTPAKGPSSRFEVKTPVSVSAVRGTEFRVAVEDQGDAAVSEVLKDDVELTGRAGGTLDLREGFGAKTDQKGVGKAVKLLPLPEVVLPVYHNPDGSLTFNVKPIDGAARYRLQIAADLAFQDVQDEGTSDKPTFAVAKAPVGNYYVRVTAIDPQGIEGLPHIYPFEYRK